MKFLSERQIAFLRELKLDGNADLRHKVRTNTLASLHAKGLVAIGRTHIFPTNAGLEVYAHANRMQMTKWWDELSNVKHMRNRNEHRKGALSTGVHIVGDLANDPY